MLDNVIGSKKEAKAPVPIASLTKVEVHNLKDKALKGKQADAVIIRASELERIKESTKVIGKEQEADEKKRLQAEKEKERLAAETMKTKIKSFDETRTKKPSATVYRKEGKDKNETLLTKAEKAMDEDLDAVESMNKMMNFAKVATIRERQLEEMKELERLKKEDDAKMDTMMEIERLKALRFHEEKERIHKDAQKQGTNIL
jgi:hypothetical protein